VCWLHRDSLNFGFLLPVGVLLIIDLVIFFVILNKITCRKKQVSVLMNTAIHIL